MKTRRLRFCAFPDPREHQSGLDNAPFWTPDNRETDDPDVFRAACTLLAQSPSRRRRIQGAVMIEPEFERLSRQIGLTFYDIAFDLTCRIAVRLLLRGLF
jgi:hypothetical protein